MSTTPRRMTLSQVVEQLLARGGGEHSSVTLARDGRTGETKIEIVARSQEGEPLEDVARRAAALYEKLATRYPKADGMTHAAPLGEPL